MMHNVILSIPEFEKMTDRIQILTDENRELKKANKFLNNQIEEYNEEFAKIRKVKNEKS